MRWVMVVDEKGRISLPSELREEMGIKAGDTVQLALENDAVRLEKKGKCDERSAGEGSVDQDDDLSELEQFLSTVRS